MRAVPAPVVLLNAAATAEVGDAGVVPPEADDDPLELPPQAARAAAAATTAGASFTILVTVFLFLGGHIWARACPKLLRRNGR
jgi:hypothetical protein